MANVNLLKAEIALLSEAVIQKYCGTIRADAKQFTSSLTGTLKHYEYMSNQINDFLDVEDNLISYFNKIGESQLKMDLKKWLEKDNRYKSFAEKPSVTPNTLRKLLFESRDISVKVQAYKDFFVLGCYIFIGIDRIMLLNTLDDKDEPVIRPKAVFKGFDTIPPNEYGLITADPGATGNKRKFTMRPVQNGIKGKAIEFNYDGNSPVVLNRANLDPENNTITGKVQAQLSFLNGQWKVENFSEYNTTYLQILRPVQLQKGDILVMGNKTFIFEDDDD